MYTHPHIPNAVVWPAQSAIVTVKGASASTSGKVIKPSLPHEEPDNINDPVAWWGDSNALPDELDVEIEKNPTLSGAIEKKIDYLFAGGIEYGREKIVGTDKVWQYVEDPNYEALLSSVYTEQYLAQAIHDKVRYGSVFPEICFSTDKKTALFLTAQQANDCRWGIQSKAGTIDHAYINKNWQLGRQHSSPDTIKVPVIDPLLDTPELISTESALRYIYRTPFATSKTYYPSPRWYVAKTSGWLDVSNLIPKFKKALMELQMTIKYHIEVNEDWLRKKYKERYENATAEENQKILLEELKHFNEMYKGADNAGKNLMTVRWFNPQSNEYESMWTLKAFDAPTFSGEYLQDAEEATYHIQYSVGLDPTLLGSKKGSGMGAGSGSDKREAFNISMSTSQRHVSEILSPLYFIRNYNGYDPTIKLRMRTPFLQTLNQIKPDQRQNTQPQ